MWVASEGAFGHFWGKKTSKGSFRALMALIRSKSKEKRLVKCPICHVTLQKPLIPSTFQARSHFWSLITVCLTVHFQFIACTVQFIYILFDFVALFTLFRLHSTWNVCILIQHAEIRKHKSFHSIIISFLFSLSVCKTVKCKFSTKVPSMSFESRYFTIMRRS